jgi:uncharacterized protein YjiS (DUF1127 family)
VCLLQQSGRDHHEIPTCQQKDRAMNHLLDVSVSTPQSTPRFLWFRRLLRGAANNLERARTRRLLGQLDDRQLSDLNISHADRLNEMDKPFWR